MIRFLRLIQVSFLIIISISVSAEYKLGKDYRLADNPLPIKKDGIVEVTESFWYGCYACYAFEPSINSWAAEQDSSVTLRKMPVSWSPVHRLHASLYYTIESLKLDDSTHSAVFISMHKEGNMLQTEKRVQDFLGKFGIAPEITKQYLNSFTIKQKINRDAKHAKQLLLSATPMLVVDGKYIIESGNEIGIPNLVTSVLASYRGYDTLGEITVIFTACIGVLILLGRSKDDYKGIISKERF